MDSEDDMDDLLDKIESTKVETKPKPLAGASKPRPGLVRQRSNSLEEDDEGSENGGEVKNPPGESLEVEKKPFKGLTHIPLTPRPKTNPNVNLLGNPFFGKEGPTPEVKGSKPFKSLGSLRPDTIISDKGQSPFKIPLKPSNPPQQSSLSSAKTDSDWLGFGTTTTTTTGGGESPPQIKSMPPKGTGDGYRSEFNLGKSTIGRGVTPDFQGEPSSQKTKTSKFPEPLPEKKPRAPEFDSEYDLPPFLETLTKSRALPPTSDGGEQLLDGKPTIGGVRKKVVVVRKPPGSAEPTLQVPSHVIDQDELKRMFLSQKELYENQLGMLETGYKEQMDCLIQSYSRKEEMLKEEIKMMQKDMEERMGRLKGELAEAERKPLHFRAQNQEHFHLTSSLSEQVKNLTEILTNHDHRSSANPTPPDPSPSPADLNKMLDIKLSTFLTAVDTSFSQRLAENGRSLSPADEVRMKRLDQILAHFDAQAKFVATLEENQEKYNKRLESDLSRMFNEQKRFRDTLVKSTVTNLTQSLETKHEDHRKHDKLSTQIRQFRRDFQHLLVDFERKQDSVQKSQMSIQGEQKGINQNLHDLSTWLKLNHDHQKPPEHHPHSQSSVQNEMELRLLREERNSASEMIAQMNVDKRRLQDEKIQLEADKRELERHRVKVQDLETTLRIRIADAEESKNEADGFRAEQSKLSDEMSRKTKEAEKERIRYREMSDAAELEHQRHSKERTEILSEREFLDKLRLQSLCPACLRLVRSQGDGIDTQPFGGGGISIRAQVPPPPHAEPPDIEREGKRLNQMIANYYGSLTGN